MTNEYLNNKVFETNIIKFQKSKKNKSRSSLILEDVSDCYKRKLERSTHTETDLVEVQKCSVDSKQADAKFSEVQQVLAVSFYTLSQQIVSYAKFHMIDPDDAIQEGVMICFDKVDRFDSRKGKAFNYMTTCILNHFRQLYRTARNYNELKRKYLEYAQSKLDQKM